MTNTTLPNSFDTQSNARASSIPFVDAFMTRDPTTSDIQYDIQKKWLNTVTGAFWELQNFNSISGVTTAHWVLIAQHNLVVETLTGNDLVVVGPTANNINVVGDVTNILTTGNAGTSTLTINLNGNVATTYVADVGSATPSAHILNVLGVNGIGTTGAGNTLTIGVSGDLPYFSLTPYIVGTDTHSQYTTIASAITQAVSDGASTANPKNIYIKPKSGGYTENLSISDGINLIGFGEGALITGKISYSTAGLATLHGLSLKTNSDFCISMTGSAASVLNVFNCDIIASNNTAISQTSSSGGSLIAMNSTFLFIQTTGITAWSMSGAGFISIVNCSSGNTGSSTTASDNSAGLVNIFDSIFDFPLSSSGTGGLNVAGSIIGTTALNTTSLTYNGTGISTLSHSTAASGTASTVVIGVGATCTVQFVSAGSSNAFVLTGAGTLNYAFISFPGASMGHNVAVEVAIPNI